MVEKRPHSFRVIENDVDVATLDEPPRETVGAFLREARQTTGYGLADIAEILNIRAKFLQAIEEGRFEDLPGPTYAAGFVRSYAEFLGLDTAAMVTQFKAESSGAEAQPDLEFPVPSTVGWFPTGKIVASCAVLAGAVFGGWFYLQSQNSIDVTAVPLPPSMRPAVAADAPRPPVRARTNFQVATAVPHSASDGRDRTDAAAASENLETFEQPPGAEASPPSEGGGDPRPTDAGEALSGSAGAAGATAQPPSERAAAAAGPPAPAAAETAAGDNATAAYSDQDPMAGGNASAGATRPATPAAQTPAATDEPSPPQQPATVVIPPPPPAPPEPAVQIASLPATTNDSATAPATDDGRTYGVVNQEARVVIGARADSWVQVLDAEQNVLLTRMLRAGDRYLVPNRNDLVMLTGNAGGLIISVDGERVPRIGSDGAILHNVRLDVDLLKSGRAVIQ